MATNITTSPPIVEPATVSPPVIAPVKAAPFTRTIPYRRIYVWELPVRLYHWINAASILLLFATGIMIGWPQTLWMSEEPSQQYWFGWVRFIHFAAAYIFLFNILFRVYWSFVGNEYARWSVYIPYRKDQFESLKEVFLVDMTQIKERGAVTVGHNYMAAATYLGLLLLSVFQIVSGFGLYASMSDSWLPHFFGWIVPLMGGDANVRQWHHIVTWAFPIFTLIHVYLACYHDYVEGRGTLSSIVDGWKFERDDEFKK